MNNKFLENHSSIPSVFDMLHEVEEQCEMEAFPERDIPRAKEACLVIAEVLLLNPKNQIRVNGVLLSVGMVQEVYRTLANEHVSYVLETLSKNRHEIKNPKMYLRTALYNSVFQLENHYENEYRRTEE